MAECPHRGGGCTGGEGYRESAGSGETGAARGGQPSAGCRRLYETGSGTGGGNYPGGGSSCSSVTQPSDAKKIGIMYTTSEANSVSAIEEYKSLVKKYDFELVEKGITTTADVSLAADDLLSKVDCITNLTDNTVVASLPTILDKANEKKIPVFGSEIEQVKIGCLAAEGIDYIALGKQTGKMAAKVLKGEAKASEQNFETITEPGFYVNNKVAENLGITVPDDLANNAVESFDEITAE